MGPALLNRPVAARRSITSTKDSSAATAVDVGFTALKRLIANAEGAGCHVRNGSEDTVIEGSSAQLAAAGYRGSFPILRGVGKNVGYANARDEAIYCQGDDLYKWVIPLLEDERAPRLAEITAAEGLEDPSMVMVGWFSKDRLRLASEMARQLGQHHDAGLADALLRLLSSKDYPFEAGRGALEDAVAEAHHAMQGPALCKGRPTEPIRVNA